MQSISEITQQQNIVNQNGSHDFEPRQHKISAAEYHEMIEAGIYDENDKIELIDGILTEKMPKNAPHSTIVRRSNYTFLAKVADLAIVQIQDVVMLNDDSEPEPDLVLLKLPLEKYDLQQPTVEDVLLIMEVSDATLRFYRVDRYKTYAKSGVMQYIILNVNSREIEDYCEPSGENYRYKKTFGENENFNLVAFLEIEIKVADLLPALQNC